MYLLAQKYIKEKKPMGEQMLITTQPTVLLYLFNYHASQLHVQALFHA